MWVIVTDTQHHSWVFPYDEQKYNLWCAMNCNESVEIVLT